MKKLRDERRKGNRKRSLVVKIDRQTDKKTLDAIAFSLMSETPPS